ncbi:hypothetical protein PRIPAC_93102 [Pristionchus pacificus]|uniref:Uncharacterized protein n=1 Tax=Pristionchus pacificus TaxID=54126 RepID=A0A2A6BQN1_PRIPA|nr:hypothetical protein PRIPAC_93102 [Pristionchus pacificus]|eukprot:PDM68187.1 hypothetical protein PRIPAC_46231 [Pristionchus pacificus]
MRRGRRIERRTSCLCSSSTIERSSCLRATTRRKRMEEEEEEGEEGTSNLGDYARQKRGGLIQAESGIEKMMSSRALRAYATLK